MTAGQTDTKRITTPQLVARIALVLIVGGAVTALALTNPDPDVLTDIPASAPPALAPAPLANAAPTAPFSMSNLPAALRATADGASNTAPAKGVPAIPNPTAWQYDPVTNQHFEPNHGHWHAGLPPSEQQQAQPSIPNPQPWQYDPTSNKHWNPLPGHQHWHEGPPPPADQRGAGSSAP